ncbi:hypothetical protein [Chromobacterium haemolyticum]|uniref:hypothetical protein n=1 Tax=Chromobacterium haemolyticum TaxID=394935 RepID=UPI000D307349|nr:hypothetical protein [Chromobacterium haemolyticum]PTU68615.1 hypothetical protein DBB33_03735 [Chromobacterium haemolyticum]
MQLTYIKFLARLCRVFLKLENVMYSKTLSVESAYHKKEMEKIDAAKEQIKELEKYIQDHPAHVAKKLMEARV